MKAYFLALYICSLFFTVYFFFTDLKYKLVKLQGKR